MKTISPENLLTFVTRANASNHSYFRQRRELFDYWRRCVIVCLSTNVPPHYLPISSDTFNSINLYLTSRNDGVTESSRLAFVTALDELMELLEDENKQNGIQGNGSPSRSSGSSPILRSMPVPTAPPRESK